MKLRFFALIVAIVPISLFASPVSGTIISYTDKADLLATFENDSNYIFSELNLRNLTLPGYEDKWVNLDFPDTITLVKKSLSGTGILTVNFKQPNTTFGATWADVVLYDTSFEVYGSGMVLLDTFVVPANDFNHKGKSNKTFFGVRGDEGEMIQTVRVDLNGATLSVLVHNAPVPVPEPTTMLLLGSGILGLVIFRKKFRKG